MDHASGRRNARTAYWFASWTSLSGWPSQGDAAYQHTSPGIEGTVRELSRPRPLRPGKLMPSLSPSPGSMDTTSTSTSILRSGELARLPAQPLRYTGPSRSVFPTESIIRSHDQHLDTVSVNKVGWWHPSTVVGVHSYPELALLTVSQ